MDFFITMYARRGIFLIHKLTEFLNSFMARSLVMKSMLRMLPFLLLGLLPSACKKKGNSSQLRSNEVVSPTQDFAPKAEAIEGCLEK